jgi:hypothetical protein
MGKGYQEMKNIIQTVNLKLRNLIMESKCCQVGGDFIDVITKCQLCSGSCNEIDEIDASWQN